MTRHLLPLLLLAGLCGCREQEEAKQPTAAEVEKFTGELNQADAVAKNDAVQASRAKEQAVEKESSDRLRAQN